jgi:hypothetical protein
MFGLLRRRLMTDVGYYHWQHTPAGAVKHCWAVQPSRDFDKTYLLCAEAILVILGSWSVKYFQTGEVRSRHIFGAGVAVLVTDATRQVCHCAARPAHEPGQKIFAISDGAAL